MHKEAEESIKKAVALGPRCYNCLRAASAVYHRQNRFIDALAYDSLLLKYHPDDVETHLQIADDLQKANMYARSVYYVETVLDVLTPTRSEKVRALVQASLAKRFTGELVDALKYSREAVRSTMNVVAATDDKHVKRYVGEDQECRPTSFLFFICSLARARFSHVLRRVVGLRSRRERARRRSSLREKVLQCARGCVRECESSRVSERVFAA